MRKLFGLGVISAMLVLTSCDKTTDEGPKQNSGDLTLRGTDKLTGDTIVVHETFHVRFRQDAGLHAIYCELENDELVCLLIGMPGDSLPLVTTTYSIVNYFDMVPQASNEVWMIFLNQNSGGMIGYQSMETGEFFTLTKSAGGYAFELNDLRLDEITEDGYSEGNVNYYEVTGSFRFAFE